MTWQKMVLGALLTLSLQAGAAQKPVDVTIGVAGSEDAYWKVLTQKAKAENINIKLISFSDYALPNKALANGDVDLNAFQHLAFLSQFNVNNQLTIVPIGTTQIVPMALYSEKYRELKDIPQGAQIALPNDPSNQGRALKVLESSGLLTLKDGAGLHATPDDIVENPRKLKILPVVAQQTPRVLADVAASVVNQGVAVDAGLPADKILFQDDPTAPSALPYVNVFAAREKDKDNPVYQRIVALYHQPDVIAAVKEDTKGVAVVVDLPAKDLQDKLNQLEDDLRKQ
ncbi:MetQ/NlpA family ABC transporter substrate-binding protein [Pectobacterium zantedeschiae]|uniref:Lipoprotein n=1 Tax=Pectobacterium zantedeschiae TaxID=2034769 RepID=A0A9X8P4P5_9GAMM|nr:MetQ/NlpA family ABC transporter substrate-binding protein [Pectobacterium zantedeschiae]RYC43723.1 MetQ/NlpA family ABC transporter substrate-binding protein [Pectobacterium zantedeschiae]RYC49056.1 methionine ABC transporter substrate-binding protein [Pectobacterium zantedeschiae]